MARVQRVDHTIRTHTSDAPLSAAHELRPESPLQPLPPCRDVHTVRYELAASGPLPAFDPRQTVKQKLVGAKQTRMFNYVIHRMRHVSFPMYLLGYVLRAGVIFGPVAVGRALGPLALVLQLPTMLNATFALRVEFVRVIARTFEFWFLVLIATVWSVSLVLYLQDARAVLAPQCYVDFVNLVLIETYFQDSRSVILSAAISAAFQLALSVAVSLSAVDRAQSLTVADLDTHVFTLKDVLVNTMATMIMLFVRLAFRKAESLRKQRQAAESWTQSISYRCRTTLREVSSAVSVRGLAAPATEVSAHPASSESLPKHLRSLTRTQRAPSRQ